MGMVGMVGVMGLSTAANAQFDSVGVELHSRVALADFPGQVSWGSDCWGYVSPSGREYVIMGLSHSAGFVDVTDPANPVVLGQIPHVESIWMDVKVLGEYAYIVTQENNGGIQIADLTDIDNGNVTLAGTFTSVRYAHNIAIDTDSGFAYLGITNLAGGGLVAVDLNNPTNLSVAGTYGTSGGRPHDVMAMTYHEGPYAGREVAFLFNEGAGLEIVDVTDKGNIFRIGRTTYPGLNYCHQGWISEDLNYLYVGDELDENNGFTPTTRTLIFDVSDLSTPGFVRDFTNNITAIDHNQYVHQGLLFQANYSSGMRVWNIGDPLNPVEIGYFDTYPQNNAISFNGAWNVFPFFPSGLVVVSDRQRGLFILDASGVKACALADFNNSGTVDTQDFIAFLNAFSAGDPSADSNHDGTVNTLDFLFFLNAFSTGCP